MQENNKLWLEIKEMFETSQTEVTIFNGAGSDSAKICDMLRVTSASAMGAVILNTSGVVFDDWIRLYGGDTSDRVGISKINLLSKNGTPEKYEINGVEGLIDHRGKSKKQEDLTEADRLRMENKILQAKLKDQEMEIKLLKKLRELRGGGH